MDQIPDNSKNTNYKLCVLDPLSTIIKLAIIGNKPVGTKLFVNDNILYIQEPGIFQALCRMYYNTNKTDLQYLYNPIFYACQTYLSDKFIDKTPAIKKLFSRIIKTQRDIQTVSNNHIVFEFLYQRN